jgi:hypothetical protein
LQCNDPRTAAGFPDRQTQRPRIVNTWGESWVLKASNKVETIPDDPFWIEHPHVLLDAFTLDDELKKYKLVDTEVRLLPTRR